MYAVGKSIPSIRDQCESKLLIRGWQAGEPLAPQIIFGRGQDAIGDNESNGVEHSVLGRHRSSSRILRTFDPRFYGAYSSANTLISQRVIDIDSIAKQPERADVHSHAGVGSESSHANSIGYFSIAIDPASHRSRGIGMDTNFPRRIFRWTTRRL